MGDGSGAITQGRGRGRLLRTVGVLGALLLGLAIAPAALAASGWKVVRYHHARVTVPAAWPVYDLSSHPHECVRFDRHAVYLGVPAANQRCPAHAVGRTEAILLGPRAAEWAVPFGEAGMRTSGELPMGRGVVATVTWGRDPQLLDRALGIRSVSLVKPVSEPRLTAVPAQRAAAGSPGAVYTGRGFDACSAPSESQMSAWSRTRYHAVGIYIGGVNMGCSQPNLSAGWVSTESAAGWHLIPTYVGLQAPSNNCGCSGIDPRHASSEGAAAANDAVTQAQALGIGPGNPIYDDMEGYSTGGTNTSAVMAFLSGWTSQLHADGYKSGVYSNTDSGISDLAARMGTTYPEPDDIWFAEWNGQATTSSAYIPSGDWAAHQRLHQYGGGHNETHGGVTLNIDSDYLDGATAAAGSAPPPTSAPQSITPPSISGQAVIGQTLSASAGSWSGAQPISYTYQWQRCDPKCAPILGATLQTYTPVAADAATSLRIVVRASNALGSGRARSAQLGPVVLAGPTYWLYTALGDVYRPAGTPRFGSPATQHIHTSTIVGMAATADRQGYWLVTSTGTVYPYGDAAPLSIRPHHHLIKGIVASPFGGYWLYTAQGNVYRTRGAREYGSPAAAHIHTSAIVGMAATPDGRGYWLVTSTGTVYPYGDAAPLSIRPHHHLIKGIVASPFGGYWLYTAEGNVYRTRGAREYGSPAAEHAHTSAIVGMAATADGKGYWLTTSTGTVYAYGDAAPRTAPHPHPIAGIVG